MFKAGYNPFPKAEDNSFSFFEPEVKADNFSWGVGGEDAAPVVPTATESGNAMGAEKLSPNEIERLKATSATLSENKDSPVMSNVAMVENAIQTGETNNKNALDVANVEANAIEAHKNQQVLGSALMATGVAAAGGLGALALFAPGVYEAATESLKASGLDLEHMKDQLVASAKGTLNFLYRAADGSTMIPEINLAQNLTPSSIGLQQISQGITV